MNPHLLPNLLLRLPLVLIILGLVGCFGEGPKELFDDYQTKIANVQDADEIQEDRAFESLPR
ncbi:DUF3080 domain-containing protein, partial [Vibrio sp. 10N.222.55.E8]